MNRDAILPKLQSMIADSLAVDESAVTADARLIDDLGADSLDFVDILFSLEKSLGLKLRSASVDAFLRAEFSESDLVEGRWVPQAEIGKLAQWMPALAKLSDLSRIAPAQVYQYITVETFVRIAAVAAAR